MRPENLVLLAFISAAAAGGGGFALCVRTRQRWRGAVVVANGALLVALLGLLLVAGEAWYRFGYDATDAYHITKTSLRWSERHYSFNNLGVRDEIDYALRRDGRPRVTFFGDSFTNGHGVADPSSRFANLFRASRPGAEVHIFARDGLDTGPLLEWLDRLLRAGYELDTVVYAYTLNDVSDLLVEWNRTAEELYSEPRSYWVRNSFLINTYYFRWRIGHDRRLRSYFDDLLAAYEGDPWERQQRRLGELAARVEQAGGALRVVTFPFFEVRGEPRYRDVHAKLGRFWSGLGVPQLDLLDTYAGFPTRTLVVNRHDSHPNERAHALAAGAIDRWLR